MKSINAHCFLILLALYLQMSSQSVFAFNNSSTNLSDQNTEYDNSNSFFFNQKKLDPRQVSYSKQGGESGGGGGLVGLYIAKTASDLIERLHTYNPDHLNIEDFKNLVDTTKIEFSSVADEFVLNGEMKDAINYFPGKKLVRFYYPRWEKYTLANTDVSNLVYHEFIPYFFGNDFDYIRARDKNFKDPITPSFSNVMAGQFSADLNNESKCMADVKFDKIRKLVYFSWIDNTSNGKQCDSDSSPIKFQCETSAIFHCVSIRLESKELVFNMSDLDSLEIKWVSLNSSSIASIGGGPMKRISVNKKSESITVFNEYGFYEDNKIDYSEVCQKAFEIGEKKAINKCQNYINPKLKQCLTIDSNIVSLGIPRPAGQCLIDVAVKVIDLK